LSLLPGLNEEPSKLEAEEEDEDDEEEKPLVPSPEKGKVGNLVV